MGAYTVPTKGQKTASRKNIKIKYKQMGAYTVPTKVSGPHPDFLCTNQGPKGESPSDNTRILNKPDKYNNIISQSRF
jgi:hypothetical protein